MGREEGGGFRWRVHFDIWQNECNYVKFKNKIKLKKNKIKKKKNKTPQETNRV